MATDSSASSGSIAASALSKRIRIGLLAGALAGLFFGEHAAVLRLVADGFVRLLQMTVLPYVTISIVARLGSLDFAQARTMGKRVGAVMVALWAAAIAAALLVALVFPRHESASFFSTAMLEEREGFDFLGLYIPTNPFNSLANNIVPAVVLFSLFLGLALIPVPKKGRLIKVLTVASAAIANATNFIVSLTPYGVFAISAVVVGTLDFDTLARLQVYLFSYVGVALLLGLWVLPGIVAALTPVPFRAIMRQTRDALILAFMTTSLFAVLPMLTENVKALLREYVPAGNADELPDVIVPVSFNFPHAGKLLSLSFILFAAWFSDTRVAPGGYLQLMGTGMLVMFGNVNAAIPFLLDMMRIPSDTFQLFVTSGIINARFGTLVAAVHTVTVALLGTCAVIGVLRFDLRKIMRFAILTGVLIVATVAGLRMVLSLGVRTTYDRGQVIANMEAARDRGAARVFRSGEPVEALPALTTSLVARLHQRGTIRVGYFDDSLPYAFFNGRDQLVGLDVEMAQQLASDLGLTAEFVPVPRSVLTGGLDASVCDVVMSGVVVTAERALSVQFSEPYLDETLAFIVPDHRVSEFSEWSTVRKMDGLRIGVPATPYFLRRVHDELPGAEMVPIVGMADIFTPHTPPIDAFVAPAERGSAYTLLHPEYAAVVPKPRPLKVPLAYVVANRDREFAALINTWIGLKRKDGTVDELFAHWILGQNAVPRQPRWSILRNVLHVMR